MLLKKFLTKNKMRKSTKGMDGFLATAVNDLMLSKSEKTLEQSCSYINIRPTAYQTAMIEVVSKIRGKNPTALMQDAFSEELANILRCSKDFIPAIERVIQEKENDALESGALKVLEEQGCIHRDFKVHFNL